MLHVDHVIYGVRDLDAAAHHLYRKHGLASAVGGRHPAWGTENRIVPLNDAYLELMTVFDPELAAKTPLGRFVAQRIARGDGFLGWMAAGEGFEDRAAALELQPEPFGRQRPDGSEVRWRLAGLETMIAEPPLPALIAWDDSRRSPVACPWHTVACDHEASHGSSSRATSVACTTGSAPPRGSRCASSTASPPACAPPQSRSNTAMRS